MVSDVLFEAVQAIKQYQRDMPHVYGGDLAPIIDGLVAHMVQVREVLDTPFPEKSEVH
jgi:hypothetical protein